MSHTCHAAGCSVVVPPSKFMCRQHWFRLRKQMRDAIWREYRPGQERDKRPSKRYLCVQQRAIGEVAFKPHDEESTRVSAPHLLRAEHLRRECVADGLGDPLGGIVPEAAS